jgi:hypothetical protein
MQRTICVSLAPSLSSCGAHRGRCTVALFAGAACCLSLRPERSEEVSLQLRCRACGIEKGLGRKLAETSVAGAPAASSVGCGVLVVLPLSPFSAPAHAPQAGGPRGRVQLRASRAGKHGGFIKMVLLPLIWQQRSTQQQPPHAARSTQHAERRSSYAGPCSLRGADGRTASSLSAVRYRARFAARGTDAEAAARLERGVHQEPAVPAQAPSLSWKCCPAQRERAPSERAASVAGCRRAVKAAELVHRGRPSVRETREAGALHARCTLQKGR